MGDGTPSYQGLERLTHMPDRTGNQGDRIAGQKYYDVYITGGDISGVTFSGITSLAVDSLTINGLANKVLVTNGSGVVEGSTTSKTELGYLTDVTSSVQTQLDGKLSLTGGTMTGDVVYDPNTQVLLDDSITTVGANLPLAFDGDGDTGFFRSAANIMNAAAGGTSICRFQSGTATGLRMDRALYMVNGANIASAATIDLGVASGNTVLITGTTNISSFSATPPIGSRFTTRFQGILTLVNSANLICLTGADVTTAANDVAEWHYESASVWRMISYTRANGTALSAPAANLTGTVAATQGGTGQTSYAVGDLLYANTTTTLAKLSDVSAGSYLRSNGVNTAPVWSTATLPNTATTGNLIYAAGSNSYSNLTIGSTGQILKVSGGVPVWANDVIVDRAYASYTTNANLNVNIPWDDTIPQNTEGTQILSATITPKSVTNRLRVRFQGWATAATAGDILSCALFVNSGSDAVSAMTGPYIDAAGGITSFFLEYEFVPGSTSTQTLAIRVGGTLGTGNVFRMNGSASARKFGGVSASTLVIEEIMQ